MKNSQDLKISAPGTTLPKDQLLQKVSDLAGLLEQQGFEVNTREKNYRVLMFRRDNRQWTQVYYHLGARTGQPSWLLRVFGPEEHLATWLSQKAKDL